MTAAWQVFYEDSYLSELTATVTAVNGDWIELDQTIFYPLGGGQPGDTGVLVTADGAHHKVIDTRKSESPGQIRHQLESDAHSLNVGDAVQTSIDWGRRFRHMRMHLAQSRHQKAIRAVDRLCTFGNTHLIDVANDADHAILYDDGLCSDNAFG